MKRRHDTGFFSAGSSFSKFINFGLIGDRLERRDLALGLYRALRDGLPPETLPMTNAFTASLRHILSQSGVRELCADHTDLAETVTRDMLDFIGAVKREIDAEPSPFETEEALLEECADLKAPDFKRVWEDVAGFIQERYRRDQFDTGFYARAFREGPGKRGRRRIGFDGVKAHFIKKWRGLLEEKRRRLEEERVKERRDEYCRNLRKRIAAMRALEELYPDGDAGYLWKAGALQRAKFDAISLYAEQLKRDPFIAALAERLGRARKSETEVEEVKAGMADAAVYASKADLTGVRESDDLSGMIPSETALLADETCRLLFFKKFAEKKLQTFAYKQALEAGESLVKGWRWKEVSRGPFILCIDTSGSMRGAPETTAKTLCFALLKIALRERRSCYLISFGVGVEALDLTDLANALAVLTGFLSESFYGGTNPMPALDAALRALEKKAFKKADVVMVSDFIMPPLDAATCGRMGAARAEGTRFHGVLIGDPDAAGVNRRLLKDFDSLYIFHDGFQSATDIRESP